MSHPNPPGAPQPVQVGWSLATMDAGAPGAGALTINMVSSTGSVALNKGDMVQLYCMTPGWLNGWTFTPDPSWTAVANGNALNLIWGGSHAKVITDKDTTISLTVTPSAAPVAAQFSVSVQLFQGSAAATNAPTITFNLIAPALPVVAFAQTSSLAVLSAHGAIAFQNTLVFTLVNTQSAQQTVKNGVIELQLIAHDSAHTTSDLSQDLKRTGVTGVLAGETLVFSAAKDGWSAPIQATSWGADEACTITVTNLPLDDATITLLEAQFTLTGIGTQSPYPTSAWANAIGPAELVVSLDQGFKESGWYRVDAVTADNIAITSVKPDDQPPTRYSVTLNDGSKISTNLGYVAWGLSDTCNSFQIDKPLNLGDNPLYFLATPNAPIANVIIRLDNLTSGTPSPVDFSGLDLSNASTDDDSPGKDLSNWKNLQKANFAKANLSYVRLQGTDLTGANLNGAILTGTHLQGTNLTGANLSGAVLTGANLQGANLSGVNLDGAILSGVNLSGVTSGGIQGVPRLLPDGWVCSVGYLIGPGASLAGANLANASLTNDFHGAPSSWGKSADLYGAILTGVRSGQVTGNPTLPRTWMLTNGYLVGPGANLQGANLTKAFLGGACLDGTNLAQATLDGSVSGGIYGKPAALPTNWMLINGYLIGPRANLSKADLAGFDLKGVDLAGANLFDADLVNAMLDGANLMGATLPKYWDPNGSLVFDGSNNVYLVIDGFYRWVPDEGTLNNLFAARSDRPWRGTNPIGDSPGTANPYLAGASLLGDPRDGGVYLKTASIRRHIVDPDSFNFFNFDGNKVFWVLSPVTSSPQLAATLLATSAQYEAMLLATMLDIVPKGPPLQKDLPYT